MTSEQARLLALQFAGLMESEVPTTCKVLGAVKGDNRDYKPDPKARTAWQLATHIATSDAWFLDSIINGTFAFDPEAAKRAEAQLTSPADVVAFYRTEIPARLATIKAMPDAHLTRDVDFFGMMKQPAVAYLGLANNHSVHHRGQLAAYLRPMGSSVPSIYGGSADEPMGM
ncbi:MAG: DinB family protein [Vicinamibacterales bacterium]